MVAEHNGSRLALGSSLSWSSGTRGPDQPWGPLLPRVLLASCLLQKSLGSLPGPGGQGPQPRTTEDWWEVSSSRLHEPRLSAEASWQRKFLVLGC
jgi:hypothetical protein